jgi:hypothetical protein
LEFFCAGAALPGRSIKNGRDAKQTIAIAVKYPMKSAAIVISSITPREFCKRCCKKRRKAVPYITGEIGGEIELFLALRGDALRYLVAIQIKAKRPPGFSA